MTKITLSFTTLNNVHKFPCWWYNKKLMGLKEPDNEYKTKGKTAHEKFAKLEKLPFDLDFPVSEVHFKKPFNNSYLWHGWADRVNYKARAILEFKTVNKRLWTNSDVDKTMQLPYYSWISNFKNVFLLTSHFDLDFPVEPFFRLYTDKDWKRAEKWAMEGYKIIEKTDWKKLTCAGDCSYGTECRIFQRKWI